MVAGMLRATGIALGLGMMWAQTQPVGGGAGALGEPEPGQDMVGTPGGTSGHMAGSAPANTMSNGRGEGASEGPPGSTGARLGGATGMPLQPSRTGATQPVPPAARRVPGRPSRRSTRRVLVEPRREP